MIENLLQTFPGGAQSSNVLSRTIRELGGDSAQYFAGLVLMGLANTIVLPLYLRCLTAREFGLYALIEVVVLGLISISGLGFNMSYLKWFADGSEPSKIFGTMFLTSGLAGAGMGLVLAVFALSQTGMRVFEQEARQFAILLGLVVLLETLEMLFHTHLRARRRPTAISVASVVRLLGIALFSIWFIAIAHLGLKGLFAGRALADLVALSTNFAFCARDLRMSWSARCAAGMLRYGAPLVAIALIMIGLDGVGRYLVDHYASLDQVGVYAAGIKISNLMRILFVAPLGTAWGGLVFQIAKKPNAAFIYSKLLGYIVLLSAAVAAALAFVTPVLFLVLSGPAYKRAIPLVPWLLLVQVASIVQCPASVGIYVNNLTRYLLPIYLVGLGVEFVAGRILVPRYGMFGAAWAWFAGWSLISLLMLWLGQRHYRLRFEWKALAFSCLLLVFVPVTRYVGTGGLTWRSFVLQALGSSTTIVAAAVYILRDIRRSQSDLDRIRPPEVCVEAG